MKIERLRNKKNKLIFLCGFLLVVVLLITLVFKGSKAKYRSSQIIPLINTKVTNNISDFTVMGIYLNDGGPIIGKDGKKYTKQEDTYTMPSSGYVINEANSYCTIFANNESKEVTKADNPDLQLYTDILGNHSIKGIKKGYKCHLFFDEGTNKFMSAKNFLLGVWGYEDVSTITERTDFTITQTDSGNKVHKALDDYGTSYYLVGNPDNNWVKFGGYYWRIVKINGNGTIKIIYQGTGAYTSGGRTYLPKTSSFNVNYEYGYYVGFMYSEGTRTGYSNSSTIKNELDTFYSTKLADYDSYIDKNTGFCNDRTVTLGNGFDDKTSNFAPEIRLRGGGRVPLLTCTDSANDLFTVKTANNGNKKLTYPIGLITADEVAMGGVIEYLPSLNLSNMFNVSTDYWTMSPSHHNGTTAAILAVRWNGTMSPCGSNAEFGVRPVINLVKDIKFSKGNGKPSSPFEI